MTVAMFICWRFTVEGNEDLFEQADAVTEALLDQERCTPEVRDSAVSADRSGRVMEIEVTVHAASEHEAIAIGHAAIRSAIHAVGGTTAQWPHHDEMVSLLPTGLRTERVTSGS
ncbi:MAG: hypothetical protein ACRDQ4_25080 [Pseudonocardiaceae bacterium]